MRPLVVDASVVAKWFFPEDHSDRAARLLSGRRRLLAPDLIIAEFGNITWKRHRRGEISADESLGILRDFLRTPVEKVDSSALAETALQLAIEAGRTVYDSLYVSLAVQRDCRFVTGDEKLKNALANTPYGRRIRWIGAAR